MRFRVAAEGSMSTETASGRRDNWIWYMIALVLVAGALLLWLGLFIQQKLESGNQLKIDEVRAALERWRQKGPKDYDLIYEVKRSGQGKPDMYYVEVRGGKGQRVVLNGTTELTADHFDNHTMFGLFRDIERFLQHDSQSGKPATFCRGWFSGDDGRLILFVRRVVGSSEAVEIEVKELKTKG
jgi:hypothetical protein